MKYDPKKFEELILYIARKSENDERFGMTKLNKLLYYADMMAFARDGRPITAATYQRLDNGPAPRSTVPAVKRLVGQHRAELEDVPYFGRTQTRVVAVDQPHLDAFTADELALVDEVIELFWEENASGVSAISHGELGWQLASPGESIPYEAFLVDAVQPKPTQDDLAWAREVLAQ